MEIIPINNEQLEIRPWSQGRTRAVRDIGYLIINHVSHLVGRP